MNDLHRRVRPRRNKKLCLQFTLALGLAAGRVHATPAGQERGNAPDPPKIWLSRLLSVEGIGGSVGGVGVWGGASSAFLLTRLQSSDPATRSWMVSVHPTVDVRIGELTLGGELAGDYETSTIAAGDTHFAHLELMPRVGYLHLWDQRTGIWPSLGAGAAVSFYPGNAAQYSSDRDLALIASARIDLLYRLGENVFLTAGPVLRATRTNQASAVSASLGAGVGASF